MNIRGSLLTNGAEWYLKRKPNPDKPELNIDDLRLKYHIKL